MAATALLELRYSAISAVSRAVQVLELLTETPARTVTDLALATQAGKPMISRILATLAEAGYVRKEPGSDRYALSLKLLSLGHRYSERRGFPDVALPVLQRLAHQTGELVQLAVVEGDRMRFVAKTEGAQRILSFAKTVSGAQTVDLPALIRRQSGSMITTLLHLLRLFPFLCGGHRQLALENLALRHQLAVYKRTVTRPKLRRGDRLFYCSGSGCHGCGQGGGRPSSSLLQPPCCGGSGDASVTTGPSSPAARPWAARRSTPKSALYLFTGSRLR
jgi:hypothetical protein